MDLKKTVSTVANRLIFKAKGKVYQFEDVAREFLKHHPDGDVEYLRRAHDFADHAHRDQKRKSGEPYIIHPVAVAFSLAEMSLDIETIAAAFLHDVVEDCGVDLSTLEKEFGRDLAQIVDGVTKIGKVKFRDKQEAKAENYRKMILAMSQDVRVLIVKLADRAHNMQTLHHLPPEKRRRISQETLEIFTPLAQRIGMSNLRNQLETTAFFHMEPEAYRELEAQLAERERNNRNFLENTTRELETMLEENNVKATVSSRIKSQYSIYKKMERKKSTLDGLYDYYAFRIITATVEDCYKIFGILHGKWRHIPGRIKDFIATPKPNLYQSIHTTLISEKGQPFEVQVRTAMMHRIAEEGVAAHWTYKAGRLTNVGKTEFIAWLKRVADDHKDVEEAGELLENIRDQFATKEILVFTPNSEIKTLPVGSTPLDFAYLIHTEVGHRASGAKVDGKLVPLRSKLASGNIVEIVTSKTQKPTEEWLKIVKTPSARAKIRAYLRAEEKSKSVDIGKTLFESELKRRKIPLKTINNSQIQAKLGEFGKKKIEDFYSAIGFGSITAKQAANAFSENPDLEPLEDVRENRLQKAIQKISKKSKQMITVRGHNDILVNLAKCCNPIIGDDIVGYITQGRGISVHKKGCNSFQRQNVNPERLMEVRWDDRAETQLFNVYIKVYTDNKPGMIASITNAIANTKTNVHNLNAKVDPDRNMGVFDIVLQINHLDHFNKVIQQLKRVKGFLSYERVR